MLYKSQVAHTLIQVRLVRLTSPFIFFLWLGCYFDTPPLEVRVICHIRRSEWYSSALPDGSVCCDFLLTPLLEVSPTTPPSEV